MKNYEDSEIVHLHGDIMKMVCESSDEEMDVIDWILNSTSSGMSGWRTRSGH
jgi:NAD-dependent SIR2 family protein deacetylase